MELKEDCQFSNMKNLSNNYNLKISSTNTDKNISASKVSNKVTTINEKRKEIFKDIEVFMTKKLKVILKLRKILTAYWFRVIVIVCLITNYVITLLAADMANWFGTSRSKITRISNVIFDVVFLLESVLKIVILGWLDKYLRKIYWRKKGIYFQIILSIICLIDLIYLSDERWVRILRTLVLFRIILESNQL